MFRRFFLSLPRFRVLCAFLACWLAGCSSSIEVRQESYVFGTRVELISHGAPEPQAREALAEVLREFDRLHRTYHAWRPSELTRLNVALARGERVAVAPEMRTLLEAAQRYSLLGAGLFEPAIGGLVGLWGFHDDDFKPRRPDAARIAERVAANPRSADLRFSGDEVGSVNPEVEFDFGGLAKGYALDRAAEILRQRGIRNALINIGGNVMALGRKGDRPWQVGIQDPRMAGALATLALYDGEAIGTSGDYQRYFELDGRRYSHLIDPRDGMPVQYTQAVTVLITPRPDAGLLSDVASKPIFVAGEEHWRSMARRMGVEHALRVDREGRIFVTSALRARLRWVGGESRHEVVE